MFSVKLFLIDFSLTNILFINVIIIVIFNFIIFCFILNNSIFVVPNNWQIFLEILNDVVIQLTFDNFNVKGEKYLPFISSLFLFILFNNLIGLVPYSFTITTQLIVTFTLSFTIFISMIIICFKRYKLTMLSIYLPANTSFYLALLLVPIELISYIFKPISLGVRLFANLMAGHTLLKVIIGFSWSLILLDNFYISLTHIIPLFILILLGLELGVAIIQAYVFTVLTCIYLNDSINLSH